MFDIVSVSISSDAEVCTLSLKDPRGQVHALPVSAARIVALLPVLMQVRDRVEAKHVQENHGRVLRAPLPVSEFQVSTASPDSAEFGVTLSLKTPDGMRFDFGLGSENGLRLAELLHEVAAPETSRPQAPTQ